MPLLVDAFQFVRTCRMKHSYPLLGILLLAMTCTVALPVINVTVISPAYTKIMVGTYEDFARQLAMHTLPSSITHTKLTHDVLNTQHFLADIYRLEVNFGLLEVKVLSPNGFTIYATNPDDLNTLETDPILTDLMTKGQMHSRLVESESLSPQGETVNKSAVYAYVPLRRNDTHLGAFEIVFDVTGPKQQLDRFNTYTTYGIILICSCLVGIVLFLLHMESSRALAQQQAEAIRADVEQITRHDIKTPLLGALNGITYLENYTKLDKDQMDMLYHMREAVNTGMDLINRSLDLYKMETGRYQYDPKELDILAVCRRVSADLSGFALDKEVPISATLSGNLLKQKDTLIIAAEETLCYAILSNLIKNAIEASDKDDHITIAMTTNGYFTISIHNPRAVPESIRNTFFEKFASAGKRTGTGLGTYSARLMVEVMGGDISMEASDENGTTITVNLPIQPRT